MKFSNFTESEDSLQSSQKPAIGSYPEKDQ